jgi:hypothetical protein
MFAQCRAAGFGVEGASDACPTILTGFDGDLIICGLMLLPGLRESSLSRFWLCQDFS